MVELSNLDLLHAAQKYNIPLRDVRSKNMLLDGDLQALKQGGYIINLQDSHDSNGNRLGGTHWTAFWLSIDPRTTKRRMVYFDPFGFEPPLEVQKLAESLRAIPLKYSKIQVQSLESSICGYYCLYFVWWMRTATYRSIFQRFESFLKKWDRKNPEKNRKILQSALQFV
jgi:hypothetical protein